MKSVVITGSARGFGLEMAKVFRSNDYNVRFMWLTNTKASLRFMSAPFNKRDFFK